METDFFTFVSHLPYILIWTWINLLAFTVNNQRSTSSVKEDKLNKPWRPIPCGRLTPENARILGTYAYVLAQAASVFAGGGLAQSSLLWVLGYIYNDRGGAESGFVIRNLLNAAGFASFASGALEVATGGKTVLNNGRMMTWLAVIAAVVVTTVHSQDMYDQAGDAAVGRRTVPLVIGDKPARWSIAITVTTWSYVCPLFWSTSLLGYIISGALGVWVTQRSLRKTSVSDDRSTFRIYNAWLMSIYSLPLLAQ
jgi:4-hydroxybenzoate polyprenyltransferase